MVYNKLKPDNNIENELANIKDNLNDNLKLNIGLLIVCLSLVISIIVLIDISSTLNTFIKNDYYDMTVLVFVCLITGIIFASYYIIKKRNKIIQVCIINDTTGLSEERLIISKYTGDKVNFNTTKLHGKQCIHMSEENKIKSADLIYVISDDKISDNLNRIINKVQGNNAQPILWHKISNNFKYDQIKIKRKKLILKRIDIMFAILIFIILFISIVQQFSYTLNDEIEHNNAGIALLFISAFFSGVLTLCIKPETIIRRYAFKSYNNFKRINQPPSFKVI